MNHVSNWFCAQMGAREHYAIPRALNAVGALGGLMTDYWAGKGVRLLAKHAPNKATKSLAARFHPNIPRAMAHSWNARSIAWELRLRQMSRGGSVTGRYLAYCDVGKRFSRAVLDCLTSKRELPDRSIFFGYDTCSLEVMRQLKERGVACILDQIDPCRVEIEMVQAEQRAWPEWQNYQLDVPDEFYRRHQEEWEVADKLIVNSNFSRDALIMQGVATEKIEVVPLCYEPTDLSRASGIEFLNFSRDVLSRGFSSQRPLRVLFLGQVMLRKGIQYLVKAAELLSSCPVVIDVVGPLHISSEAIKLAPANVRFHGRVTRDEIGSWYRNGHVFILPTLSDGFAITQLEAMANGLPVIATTNCGDVVSTNVDGFIIPPRDPASIADAICKYLADPMLLMTHHRAALQTSKMFSIDRLATSLLAIGDGIHR